MTWPKDLTDSTFLGHFRFTIFLLKYPDTRTPPPPRGTPTSIIILDDPISYISYISQVRAKSPMDEHFPIYTRHKIYMVSIGNDDYSLVITAVQLLQDKQKHRRYSFITTTLACQHPATFTSLEEHHVLFDQGRTLLETYHPP